MDNLECLAKSLVLCHGRRISGLSVKLTNQVYLSF